MATLLHSFNSVAVDDGRQAALVESAARGDIASVNAALRAGTRPNQATTVPGCNHPVTPLAMAARGGHTSCVQVLLQAGAQADVMVGPNRYTALFLAAQNGHAGCVAVLASAAPASIEQATLEGATPLLVSAHLGHLQSVHVLLRLQARTSCTLSDGTTTSAYEVAAAAGHAECTALLSHTTG